MRRKEKFEGVQKICIDPWEMFWEREAGREGGIIPSMKSISYSNIKKKKKK